MRTCTIRSRRPCSFICTNPKRSLRHSISTDRVSPMHSLIGCGTRLNGPAMQDSIHHSRALPSEMGWWTTGRNSAGQISVARRQRAGRMRLTAIDSREAVYFGERNKALDGLDRAVLQRDPGIVNVKTDPLFAGLRGEVRYKAVPR